VDSRGSAGNSPVLGHDVSPGSESVLLEEDAAGAEAGAGAVAAEAAEAEAAVAAAAELDRPPAALRTAPPPGYPLHPADPRELGGYELLTRLGEGGMGTVYLGRSPAGQRVAVKVVRAELADDPEYRARFRREAEVAQRVARYCTAEVLDAVDPPDGAPYLVTEFVDGPSLAETVATHGPLGSADVERLAVSVASALAVIHAAGLVHRDLKPSNVLLSQFGPRVIDFGVAWAPDAVTVTRDLVVGTPAFMAPEQARGERVTAAADVFAWGGLMIYAATGRRPFGGGAVPAVLYRIVNDEPDLDGVDHSLADLVRDAMGRAPAERPTASQLVSRLQTLSPTRTNGRGISPVPLVPAQAEPASAPRSEAADARPARSAPPIEQEPRADPAADAAPAVDLPVMPAERPAAGGAGILAGGAVMAAGGAAGAGQGEAGDRPATTAEGDDGPTLGTGPVTDAAADGDYTEALLPLDAIDTAGTGGGGGRPAASGKTPTSTVVLRAGQGREQTAQTMALASRGGGSPRGGYAEAPTASTDYPRRDEVGQRRRAVTGRLPWTTLISAFSVLVALVAVGVAAGAALNQGSGKHTTGVLAAAELTVPGDLTGLTAAEAEKRLQAAGFIHIRREMTPNVKPKGTVLQVRPGADSRLDPTETITLVVSAGLESIKIPEVVGLTEAAARGTLQDAGLTVVVRTSTGPAIVGVGRVAAISPDAGSQVTAGSTVTITVIVPNSTRSLAKMPNVVGQPTDQAQAAVRAAGFTDVALSYVAGAATAGTVTATDPSAGRSAAKNATVTLTVSTGPGHATVPDVAGRSEADARTALEGAGLVVTVRYNTGPSSIGPGLVETVDPVAGSQVGLHSKVTITVVSTQVTVPNTVGTQRAQAERTLNSYGLQVTVVRQVSDQAVGTVLDQSPLSGSVRRGSSVTLTVAKAPDPPNGGSSSGPPTDPTSPSSPPVSPTPMP